METNVFHHLSKKNYRSKENVSHGRQTSKTFTNNFVSELPPNIKKHSWANG